MDKPELRSRRLLYVIVTLLLSHNESLYHVSLALATHVCSSTDPVVHATDPVVHPVVHATDPVVHPVVHATDPVVHASKHSGLGRMREHSGLGQMWVELQHFLQ